jgi:hypothetical protein
MSRSKTWGPPLTGNPHADPVLLSPVFASRYLASSLMVM